MSYVRTPAVGESAILAMCPPMPTLVGKMVEVVEPPIETPTKGLSGMSDPMREMWVELNGVEYQMRLSWLVFE